MPFLPSEVLQNLKSNHTKTGKKQHTEKFSLRRPRRQKRSKLFRNKSACRRRKHLKEKLDCCCRLNHFYHIYILKLQFNLFVNVSNIKSNMKSKEINFSVNIFPLLNRLLFILINMLRLL